MSASRHEPSCKERRSLVQTIRFWWSKRLFPAAGPISEQINSRFWVGLVLVSLLAGIMLFPNLSYPLYEPDEGRYAEIGREMHASGDWIAPTLNNQPYYDKPPLFYWLIAGAFHLFGVSEWSARLAPTSAAFLTVLATYVFGTRIIGRRAAWLSALALTLMGGFVQTGRVLTIDSVLSLFVTLAMFTAHEAVQSSRIRLGWWLASALCCALGVLTKGPIALVLIGPPFIAYLWLNREKTWPSLWHCAMFAGVTLIVVAPWFVVRMIQDSEFSYQFFVYHHFERFLVGTDHVRPIWFYLPVLIIACLPWSLLLAPFFRFMFTRSDEVRRHRSPALGFLCLWSGWCVFFFTMSRGKLPLYILPALPALAMMVGYYLKQVLFEKSLVAFFENMRGFAPKAMVLVLCLSWLIFVAFHYQMALVDNTEIILEVLLCLAGIAVVILMGRHMPVGMAWGLCCLVMGWMMFDLAHVLAPAYAMRRSPGGHSEQLAYVLKGPATAVVCNGQEWGSITFQCRGPIFDLAKGTPQTLQQFLRDNPRTLLILNQNRNQNQIWSALANQRYIMKVAEFNNTTFALLQDYSARPFDSRLAGLK